MLVLVLCHGVPRVPRFLQTVTHVRFYAFKISFAVIYGGTVVVPIARCPASELNIYISLFEKRAAVEIRRSFRNGDSKIKQTAFLANYSNLANIFRLRGLERARICV